jgi:1-acyl-sn-glycerol-3-phosphate acyltransferase
VVLASNHLSFMDSLFIPLLLERPVVFLGKSDYFERRSTRWFFKWLKVIPVKRDNAKASEKALEAGVQVLQEGGMLGIYPEGTRSPDGRLYRGKTGVARLALAAGCPVVPVVVFGTRDLQPPGQRRPKLTGRVRVVYGKPLEFSRYEGKERDKFALRNVTDEIMYEMMMLGGQEYVDEYAARVKAAARAATAIPAPTTDAVVDITEPSGRSDGRERAE